MTLKQGKMFQYTFWLKEDINHESEYIQEIIDWCNENCLNQWAITNTHISSKFPADCRLDIYVRFYSKAKHKCPLDNKTSPPSSIEEQVTHIIAFETEEEAIAFKLQWIEE